MNSPFGLIASGGYDDVPLARRTFPAIQAVLTKQRRAFSLSSRRHCHKHGFLYVYVERVVQKHWRVMFLLDGMAATRDDLRWRLPTRKVIPCGCSVKCQVSTGLDTALIHPITSCFGDCW